MSEVNGYNFKVVRILISKTEMCRAKTGSNGLNDIISQKGSF